MIEEDAHYDVPVLQGCSCDKDGKTEGVYCYPAFGGSIVLHLVDFGSTDLISGPRIHLSKEHAKAPVDELLRSANAEEAPNVIHFSKRPQNWG